MRGSQYVVSLLFFILAALCEILGGYLFWTVLREGRHFWLLFAGGAILVLYGILMSLQSFPQFGRSFAAYGGVFIFLSILWGWFLEGKKPDRYDWFGVSLCLLGAAIILFAPRNEEWCYYGKECCIQNHYNLLYTQLL